MTKFWIITCTKCTNVNCNKEHALKFIVLCSIIFMVDKRLILNPYPMCYERYEKRSTTSPFFTNLELGNNN